MQGDIVRSHFVTQQRQKFRRDFFMYQQCFHRITDTRTLHFRIRDDRQCFMQIGGLININMAHTDTAGDHRNSGLLAA